MGYLYKHTRLDTNEVFYIGIGGFCKKEKEGSYSRAFCKNKSKRNNYWFNIINKTDYKVEIVLDNLSIEELLKKEKDYIKLYGRKDTGVGTLVNMTDGGEGHTNYICREETREKMRKAASGENNSQYGKKRSEESIRKQIKSGVNKKSIYRYSLLGIKIDFFESIRCASRETNVDYGSIQRCLKSKQKTAGGFLWKYD